MFWVKGKLTDFIVTWVYNKGIPDFQSSITEQKALQHAILGWRYTVFWGSQLSSFSKNDHFTMSNYDPISQVLFSWYWKFSYCIALKFPEKLSSTLEFKTNTFSIPKDRRVHFYFNKHYIMAIRIWKHKYQTD